MPIGIDRRVLVTMARFQLDPARRLVERVRGDRVRPRTWGVRIGPVEVCGHQVVLRSPRLDDAAAWREVRLRERRRLERWWVTSELSWEERHTEAAWTWLLLEARRAARAGRALPLVVEIDGRFSGQMNLEHIDPHARSAEMGIWLDSTVARTGVSGVAGGMLVDYAVRELGLHRLTAPIAAGNRAAVWGAQRLGLVHEGVMSGFLDVGGKRVDHHLWAITADRVPAGGTVAAMLAVLAGQRPPARGAGRGRLPV